MRKSLSLLLALLGLFDSLYLLYVYTSPSLQMVCFGTGRGCDAVRASAYAHIWGVPTPVFGVAGYVIIALLIIAELLVAPPLAIEVRYALAGATGCGFLFSLYLEYLQGFVIHAFCAWCVTSGVVMTALCALAIYNVARPAPQDSPSVKHERLQSYGIVCLAALVIGIPAFHYLATHGELPPPLPPAASSTTADRLVRPDSHIAGNPDAPVTVVEFGDFECPVCGSEEPVAREIRAKYGNRIRFVFRQFPLVHIHPFAKRMAEASECAAEQGQFWKMVDVIYSHQNDLTEQRLGRDAAEAGLDQAKFNRCMAGGAEAARVDRDHDDGKALGVVATPTIFVGRRPIADVPDVQELSRLIDQELIAKGSTLPSGSTPPTGTASSAAAAPPQSKKVSGPGPGSSHTPPPTPATTAPSTSSFGLLGAPPGGALSSFQGGIACSEEEAAKKQPTLINTSQLRQILEGNPQPLFVDVRPAKEYATGKIPGAINIPVEQMPQHWSTLPKGRTIVLYESGKSSGDICAAGRAAGRILLEHGYPFDQVKVYQDGLAGWEKSGLQAEK